MKICRNFFIVVLLISILFHTHGQNPKISWYKGYFNGEVKSYTQTRYAAKDYFGKVIKTERMKAVSGPFDEKIKYNRNGNVLEEIRYIDSRQVCIRDLYGYSEGRIEVSVYDCDSNIITKHIYNLNNQSKIVEYRAYDSVGTVGYTENTTYSLNGDTIIRQGYNPGEDRQSDPTSIILRYDQDSNIIEKVVYEFGSLFLRNVYTYNDKNKLVEKEEYTFSHGKELIANTVKYFDEKGNLVEEVIYDIDHEPAKVIEKKFTYEYELDHRGNWIKQIKYEKGIPKYIVERSFVYYE